MIGFSDFENRTIIKGKVKLLTGLHIGKGQSLEPIGTDQPVVKDVLGYPFIPGSSFKGVLRSNAERIASSLYQGCKDIIEPCFVTDDKNSYSCISHEKDVSKMSPQQIWNKMCPVCRLFGSPHFASKIAIKDLTVDKDTWFDHYEKRDGVAIDRGTETAGEGKLYDFEIVPAGVEFELNIVVENADDYDLGLLYLALKDFENGSAFIGGSKTKGLGNIQLTYNKIEEVNIDNLVDYLLGYGGKIYTNKEEEGNEPSKDETIKETKEEKPKIEFPKFNRPESVNTIEELYIMISIALSEMDDKRRKDINKIGEALSKLGVSKEKRQSIAPKEVKLEDLLNRGIKEGWFKKLDDGQYIPIGNPNKRANDTPSEEIKQEEKTEPKELPKPKEDKHKINEYDFKGKIIKFVSYITKKETENAQEKPI